MSFPGTGGGSTKKPPKVLQVSPIGAEQAAVGQDLTAISDALNFQKATEPTVFAGRQDLINNAAQESTGSIGSFAQGAVDKAGLGDVALSAPGNIFKEAINLGEPLLAPEQRSRNFVEALLQENPKTFVGLDPSALLQIALGNLGNVNAGALSNFQTQQNAYTSNLAQQTQNAAAAGQLAAGVTKAFNQPQLSPYTDPFLYSYVYGGAAPYAFGDTAPIPEGTDIAQYGV